ncbi:hypothetical protein [Rickettsia oklahomensis]|uniref:Uncharacterized protein n=1 Tax=Rickettsia oklahomensis TaxID=3141789 RepID=A0AAU7BY90_9RICK
MLNFSLTLAYVNKLKGRYLDKIEGSIDTSKQAKLKHKIVSVFDSYTAYELLSFCYFLGVVYNQYQIKLLKNMTLKLFNPSTPLYHLCV